MKQDREERGVGMQNFKYPPAWDEICNVLRIQSPQAYRTLTEKIPGRSQRNFRYVLSNKVSRTFINMSCSLKESRKPRFPMTICESTFELAQTHLQSLNYNGPVGLSCDDTKLFSALRLYWDEQEQSHFIIGSTLGPLRVTNVEDMNAILEEARKTKATKVGFLEFIENGIIDSLNLRLWCISIPVPNVSPIILAALPIANSLNAPSLFEYLKQILHGLIDHGISVISYACDGSEVE